MLWESWRVEGFKVLAEFQRLSWLDRRKIAKSVSYTL